MRKPSASVLRVLAVNDIYRLDLLPSLATLFAAKTKEAQQVHGPAAKTIACVAGDFLAPNILSGFDRGRGFLRCFNALGITHVCFGNHEADLQLHDLRKRCSELEGLWLNTNVPTFPIDEVSSGNILNRQLPRYDVVEVGGVRVGLVGLLTDEKQVFYTDTFKGLQIENVVEAGGEAERFLRKPVPEGGAGCDVVLALTHQSMKRDRELARAVAFDVIIGGHDHTPFDETVLHQGDASVAGATVRIVKAGMDAEHCSVIDIIVEAPLEPPVHTTAIGGEFEEVGKIQAGVEREGRTVWAARSAACSVELEYALESTVDYAPDEAMSIEVDLCLGVLARLENERIVLLDKPVSGVGSRFV
jgi:2',3'-cyclic-nucleotide 2'-phosphodiesterase (5'-nucleotidase family)